MTKSIVYTLLTLFMACSSSIETSTEDNYKTFELPDGSQVALNQYSTISYDSEFSTRVVELDGEAFFKVKSGSSSFKVITNSGEIKVLGTAFNVKTDEKHFEVDVAEGLVELKTEYDKSKLKKGFKAFYAKGDKLIRQARSDKGYTKWFNSVEREMKKLEKGFRPALRGVEKNVKKGWRKIKN